MAASVALPYNHQYYDSLPDIMVAAESLSSSGALDTLASSIGSVFVRHGVEKVFGLALLHRHFDMEPSEMLVEFGNVSIPWDTTCNKQEIKQIRPVSWRFVPDGIVPYEFSNNKASVPLSIQDHGNFLQELGTLLRDMRLDQLLGVYHIRDIECPTAMEFTSGRANVTVPDVMWALDSERGSVEASWQFMTQGTDLPGPVVFKKCKVKCEYKHNATPQHQQRHLTTKK